MARKILLDKKKLKSAASRLRAIAHPKRMEIISLLEEKEELNVTTIYQTLKIEQAAASHHLSILRTRGVLSTRRDGKQTFYKLRTQTISQILDCLDRCAE
jgi:DNA-binding transcriptional ArsR family regulator